jgi:hypothetical protein
MVDYIIFFKTVSFFYLKIEYIKIIYNNTPEMPFIQTLGTHSTLYDSSSYRYFSDERHRRSHYTTIIEKSSRSIAINWQEGISHIENMSVGNAVNVENPIWVIDISPEAEKKREEKKRAEKKREDKKRAESNILESDVDSEPDIENQTTWNFDEPTKKRFWEMVGSVGTCDKDDAFMDISHIDLTCENARFVLFMVNMHYLPLLKNTVDTTALEGSTDPINYDDILTHIITKGRVFYKAVLLEPSIGFYLCDNYYPIHSWLKVLVVG